MDGREPGRAVASRARLDRDPGEALASGRQPAAGADLQLGLVVGGQQQVGGVAVEHVPGAFHGALQQAVEVVRGGRADEGVEGAGEAVQVGAVGVGADRVVVLAAPERRLEHRAFVLADQQADGGRHAVGVPDPQVRPVHRHHPAVAAAQPVAALPAGQPQRLVQAEAGAGGLRPGRVRAERLADGLGRGECEQGLGVGVPAADPALGVDLDHRDVDGGVGGGQQFVRGDRPGEAGTGGAGGQVELEPDALAGGGVVDAPAGGQGGAQQQPAPSFALQIGVIRLISGAERPTVRGLVVERVRGLLVERAVEHRQGALRVAVGDLDPDRVLVPQAEHLGGGPGVHHGVGDQLAGEHHGVVHDLGETPALQGVPDEAARGRHGAADRLERGGSPRGDHVATPLLLCLVCLGGEVLSPGCAGDNGRDPVRLLSAACCSLPIGKAIPRATPPATP